MEYPLSLIANLEFCFMFSTEFVVESYPSSIISLFIPFPPFDSILVS